MLNLIAVVFNQGSTLIGNVIVARILMKQGFGEYAMVQGTLLTIATLAQVSTGFTASKFLAEYRVSDPVRAGRIMGTCAVVAAVTSIVATLLLVLLAPWLSVRMLNAAHLAPALVAGAGYIFFSSINGYQLGALSGLESYRKLALAGIPSGILAVVSISLGAKLGGLHGTLIGLSLSALIRCTIHNFALRKETALQGIPVQYWSGVRQEKSTIIHFALPAAVAGYFTLPMTWLANSFLVHQPGGYDEMALYSSSNSLRFLVLFIPQIVNGVSVSVLNNIKGSRDFVRYRRVYLYNILAIFGMTGIGGLLIGLFGTTLLSAFGKDFRSGETVMRILLISTVFEGVALALYQDIQAKGRIWVGFWGVNVPREGTFVLAAYFLVAEHGGQGLAAAYSLASVVGLCCMATLVWLLRERLEQPEARR